MVNKKISEGVGKKIVEALKKQSEIEITAVPSDSNAELDELTSELSENFETLSEEQSEACAIDDDFLSCLSEQAVADSSDSFEEHSFQNEEESIEISEPVIQQQPAFRPQPSVVAHESSFISDLDGFEIPNNIAVLKKLITQLPSGVTKHTGAQIIKQTMEALGISMKSVLQEAQQVQDGLNNSAKECHATILEYKKQIALLEKQAQNHQRQYSALNELISLFIQTGV
jgi:hypothetical protein